MKIKKIHNKSIAKLGFLLGKGKTDVMDLGKDLLESGFDKLSDGYWILDINSEKEYFSPRFISSLGYEENDCDYTTNFWKDKINEDDAKRAWEEYLKHRDDENSPYFLKVKYRHKDGKTINILCAGTIVNRNSDNPIMIGTHEILI